MLAAIWDAHVKDMPRAVCSSSSRSPTQEVTSEMKFTDTLGAISNWHQNTSLMSIDWSRDARVKSHSLVKIWLHSSKPIDDVQWMSSDILETSESDVPVMSDSDITGTSDSDILGMSDVDVSRTSIGRHFRILVLCQVLTLSVPALCFLLINMDKGLIYGFMNWLNTYFMTL